MKDAPAGLSGGYGGGETPLPIPNRAVKPLSADGTWPFGPGRVGRRRFIVMRVAPSGAARLSFSGARRAMPVEAPAGHACGRRGCRRSGRCSPARRRCAGGWQRVRGARGGEEPRVWRRRGPGRPSCTGGFGSVVSSRHGRVLGGTCVRNGTRGCGRHGGPRCVRRLEMPAKLALPPCNGSCTAPAARPAG